MAAPLFAVHPLRVESVAWATERKDVLALFFGLWALWFYAGYARRGGVGRYLGVVGFYGLSLMAKPMLVTLPVVMWLLDIWPLERWGVGRVGRVVWEKVPLLVMAGVVSGVAYGVQMGTSAKMYEAVKPVGERWANGVVSYVLYLRDMVYFGGLAIFYPWESRTPVGEWVAAGVVMAGISGVVVWMGWRRGGAWRGVMVGWFWFVVGLVPMVGVVQSGNQSRADRFTYFASIGLMMAVVWAWPEGWRLRVGVVRMRVMMGAVAGVVMVCMVMQLMLWRDPLGLYLDTLARTRDNWFVAQLVAEEYQKRGDWGKAADYYEEVVRAAPYMHEAENNLGGVLLKMGRLKEGLEHLRRATSLRRRMRFMRRIMRRSGRWWRGGRWKIENRKLKKSGMARVAVRRLGKCRTRIGGSFREWGGGDKLDGSTLWVVFKGYGMIVADLGKIEGRGYPAGGGRRIWWGG